MLIGLLTVLILSIVVITFAIGIYNRLVVLKNRFKNAFSQIDVQLKRRHDLIPNLVETTKGYLQHERQTLEAVIASRNSAVTAQKAAAENPGDPHTMKALMGAEGALGQALSRLMVLVEAYPDLKADQNMRQLSEELASTENRVAFSRQAYNDAVMEYNTARETFPNSLIAAPFNFHEAELYQIQKVEEREVPKVAFG